VIVCELNVLRACRPPFKADAELVIHTDGPLTLTVLDKLVESVSRRIPQVSDIRGGVEHLKFSPRAFEEVSGKALRALAQKDSLRLPISECLDHSL
jgi:hypothetical protein